MTPSPVRLVCSQPDPAASLSTRGHDAREPCISGPRTHLVTAGPPPTEPPASSQSSRSGCLLRTRARPATRRDPSQCQGVPKPPSLGWGLILARDRSPASGSPHLCGSRSRPAVCLQLLLRLSGSRLPASASPTGSRPFPLLDTCGSARAFPLRPQASHPHWPVRRWHVTVVAEVQVPFATACMGSANERQSGDDWMEGQHSALRPYMRLARRTR